MPEEIRFYRSTGKWGFLSNLYPCKVKLGHMEFRSSEHAYQYFKLKDSEVKEWILTAPHGYLAAIVGHNAFYWMIVPKWKDKRVAVMRTVLMAKFTQEQFCRDGLLSTKDAILIEDSKTDKFWGIGGLEGKGKNMLGKLLMETRQNIKDGDTNAKKKMPDLFTSSARS